MVYRNKQQWFGIIFCIVLATQYLHCAAKFHFHKNRQGIIGICKRSLLQRDTCELDDKPKEKRLVGTILFAISIFAMVANLAFDIYLQVKGCCGIYPTACTYRDEFLAIRDNLRDRGDWMNTNYTLSENLLEYIKQTNLNNQDIWQELNRIMILTERIIRTLDPKLLEKFDYKSAELRNALERHNQTVAEMNQLELDTEYGGIFSSALSATLGLAPLVGTLGVKAISTGLKWYKKVKVAKFMNNNAQGFVNSGRASKVLGAADVGKLAKTSTVTNAKGVNAVSKASKFAKVAGAAMSVIAIGLEIYSAVKKVKACEKVRDDCKKARDTIKPEQAKFSETEKELKEFHQNLTQTYAETRSQMTDETFLSYTLIAKKLAQGADMQTSQLQRAAAEIQTFHDGVKAADKQTLINLQKDLVDSLSAVEYTWGCFDKKVQVISYVTGHCRTGTNSLKLLFDTAVQFHNAEASSCTIATGRRYITFQATDAYVKDRMRDEKLAEDCVLNNRDKRYLVCSSWAKKIDNSKIAASNQLTEQQVAIITRTCPLASVSPRMKRIICSEKLVNSLEKTKTKYSRYNQEQIIETYNACPKPNLPPALKDIICSRKNNGLIEDRVVAEYDQYDAADIRNRYQTCTTTVSTIDRGIICKLKAFSMSLTLIKQDFAKYPGSAIDAVYNSC